MHTRFNLFKENGITLVELLIVTGVIAILITGFIVLINPLQKIAQANDSKRKGDLSQLQRALELYYQDYGKYPASTAGSYLITGTSWDGQWQPYMTKLPKDPTTGHTYIYYTPNTGVCSNYQCYYLYANLQRGQYDPQTCFPGSTNPCASAVTNSLTNKCGDVCNYGVSSPNTKP